MDFGPARTSRQRRCDFLWGEHGVPTIAERTPCLRQRDHTSPQDARTRKLLQRRGGRRSSRADETGGRRPRRATSVVHAPRLEATEPDQWYIFSRVPAPWTPRLADADGALSRAAEKDILPRSLRDVIGPLAGRGARVPRGARRAGACARNLAVVAPERTAAGVREASSSSRERNYVAIFAIPHIGPKKLLTSARPVWEHVSHAYERARV